MTRRGRLLLLFLLAVPLFAQSNDNDRIPILEQKLDELLRQAEAIRAELEALKAGSQPVDDLTAVTPVEPSPPDAPAIADVTTVDNQPAPAASKVLNPDISVVGVFLGHAGDRNEFEERRRAELDEVEIAMQAFVDPYAKANFFIAVGPEEVELEEGFATFIALPYELTAKAGKVKAMFGKANTWHTHTRTWVDQPLMISRFFGEEGFADVGISVSRPIANPFGAFIEATGEVFNDDYNAHLRFFRDITENSNIEVGTSYARALFEDEEAHGRFAGIDVTYRWKPLARAIYNSMIVRAEGLARLDEEETLYGWYLSADYQLARRWFVGGRWDGADKDRAYSATLTFWPSEFSQLRGQFRRTQLGAGGPSYDEFLLQLLFAIGPHGAHTF
jgi:hypothetical protein